MEFNKRRRVVQWWLIVAVVLQVVSLGLLLELRHELASGAMRAVGVREQVLVNEPAARLTPVPGPLPTGTPWAAVSSDPDPSCFRICVEPWIGVWRIE